MFDLKKFKTKKIALVVISLVLLVSYIAFCIVDCVRLRKSALYTKPIITLSSTEDTQNGYLYYNGLGYKIRYITGKQDGSGNIVQVGEGAEFSWLGVPIWGWGQ